MSLFLFIMVVENLVKDEREAVSHTNSYCPTAYRYHSNFKKSGLRKVVGDIIVIVESYSDGSKLHNCWLHDSDTGQCMISKLLAQTPGYQRIRFAARRCVMDV